MADQQAVAPDDVLEYSDVVQAQAQRIEQLNRDLVVRDAKLVQVTRERDEARQVVDALSQQLGLGSVGAGDAPDAAPEADDAPAPNRATRRAAKKAPAKRATPARNGRAKK